MPWDRDRVLVHQCYQIELSRQENSAPHCQRRSVTIANTNLIHHIVIMIDTTILHSETHGIGREGMNKHRHDDVGTWMRWHNACAYEHEACIRTARVRTRAYISAWENRCTCTLHAHMQSYKLADMEAHKNESKFICIVHARLHASRPGKRHARTALMLSSSRKHIMQPASLHRHTPALIVLLFEVTV